MAKTSFLDKIAEIIFEDQYENLTDLVVVLPNKRARIFLIESLRNHTNKNILAPTIISIEELIADISGLRAIDRIELIFEFYDVYCSITEPKQQQSFDIFANWAATLIQDFNEIDSYLLNPEQILCYLKDIEDIKKWGIEVEAKTLLLENYIDFWKMLPKYYFSFYNHLLNKKVGYQGLIYRESVGALVDFTLRSKQKQFIFAGFNALSPAEEKIVQHLLAAQSAKIYWDADCFFLNDQMHEAGLFLRRFKNNWKYYKNNPFEWIAGDFEKPKNIRIIGTPKSIGQAKITGRIIEDIIQLNPEKPLGKIAVILGDEHLLLPLLYSLPSGIDALNITMGYSAKNNPAQILIAKLFKLHTNALSRSGYVFYYKDILDVLTNPLVEQHVEASFLMRTINESNYTFITHKRIFELNPNSNILFKLLFEKWENGPLKVLESVSELLQIIKGNLSGEDQDAKISMAFVFAIFKIVNKLISFCLRYPKLDKIETLYALYKQAIEVAEVSFEGQPLQGLQIMGILESRVLDFETVIVTSMNEGTLPEGKKQNSFIPYDVKREFGLPTFKEKDAIYTYHFYHLLQRAKNIFLLYNTESEGLDAGEKSRFITQLNVERRPNHQITNEIYNAELPETAYRPMMVPKSESVAIRLREICESGFSPSALTSYIRNPINFYFQKILRISNVEEVEENVALNTLGTIIHETLKVLYDPFVGKILSETHLQTAFSNIDNEVLNQFKMIFKEGDVKKGKNLLAFEVAKRNIYNFLKMELRDVKNGDVIRIVALEQRFERDLLHDTLPFPVKIGGSVDRIEERNGKIRIIDYKTGKVNPSDMVLRSWDKLTENSKSDKIIQVLAYAFLYEPNARKEMEAGVISFKNLKEGFLPYSFKEIRKPLEPETSVSTVITVEILEQYKEQLAALVNQILDMDVPFTEKV